MALSRTVSEKHLQSGFSTRPDHTIAVAPAGRRLIIEAEGRLLADTAKALVLREAAYRPVYYVPHGEGEMSALRCTGHST